MKLLTNQWILDIDENLIRDQYSDEIKRLEPRAMSALAYLAQHSGEVVTRDELIEAVWNGRVVSDHAIYRVIMQIRKSLHRDGEDLSYITTIPKKGYKFVQAVSRIEQSHSELPTAVETDGDQVPVSESEVDQKYLTTPFPYKYLLWLGLPLLAIILWTQYFAGKWNYYSSPIYSRILPLTSEEMLQDYPAYSSSGSHVVFSQKEKPQDVYQLYIKDNGTETLKRITSDENNWVNPQIDDTAENLVAVRQNKTDCAVVGFSLKEGSYQSRVLFDCTGNEYLGLALSGDGKHLYYTHKDEENSVSRVFSYLMRTGKREQLTNYFESSAEGDHFIALSPDNSELAFLRNKHWSTTKLGVLDLESKKEEIVTEIKSWVRSMSWSDNGSDIIYQTSAHNIFRYSLPHGHTKPIVTSTAKIRRSVHSPDNEKLAIVQQETQYGMWNIELNQPEGEFSHGDYQRILLTDTLDYFPSYANNSKQIAFMSIRSGKQQIWIRELNGELRQLSSFENSEIIHHIAWSPDDEYIAVHTIENNGIYILDVNTGEATQLALSDSYSNVARPTWSQDGESLYFCSDKDGDFDIYKYSFTDKAIEKLTNTGVVWLKEISPDEYLYINANKPGLHYGVPGSRHETLLDGFSLKEYQAASYRQNTLFYYANDSGKVQYMDLENGQKGNFSLPFDLQASNQISVAHDLNSLVYSDIIKNQSRIFELYPEN